MLLINFQAGIQHSDGRFSIFLIGIRVVPDFIVKFCEKEFFLIGSAALIS
jgi:hypothetical protein